VDVPLVIAGFGFLQDRWGSEACKFYEDYLADETDPLRAHVLILDHPSSGPFLAENGVLSPGAYDDARIWVDVARRLKRKNPGMPIHLLGVSMSGQSVVHALLEDRRLGLDLFESGLAVSIAPDFKQTPGGQLASFDTGGDADNPWRKGLPSPPSNDLVDVLQRQVLMLVIRKQFIPNYHRINPAHASFSLSPQRVPRFFHTAFENRIDVLRSQQRFPENWNFKAFSLESLDAYMQTTRIAAVIQDVRTPLVLLSARDDPAVSYDQFREVAGSAAENPWVICYSTDHGGHFAYDTVYGKEYVGRVLQLMLEPEVLKSWLKQKRS
jgi:predicted alpha/beta-fold hydrolase